MNTYLIKSKPQTLFDTLWEQHVVYREQGTPDILYIDRHIINEVFSGPAFIAIENKKRVVRMPDKILATTDHVVSTDTPTVFRDLIAKRQVERLEANCRKYGITYYGPGHPKAGIVHVVSVESGFVLPGQSVVCGDSHTSTNGAVGALAWGIGTSEIEMVFSTQCILQKKPKQMNVVLLGTLGKGVTAKDIILTIIRTIGVNGASGYAVEYSGPVISNMTIEERLTICNMTIEAGGRFGIIAPDEKTFSYIKGRKFAPTGKKWSDSIKKWKLLKTDKNAKFDKIVQINVSNIEPTVTFGTDPSQTIGISEKIPHPLDFKQDADRRHLVEALEYMEVKPGTSLEGFPIDYIFIGTCTNGRISDLREAAKIFKGKKVHPKVKAYIVPGSNYIKKQAEEEGLDTIFTDAGCEWRFSGCSYCADINPDRIPAGKYCVSTNNRNFEGRQGQGARTFLASPIMAAAAAINGYITDVRDYL
jgi:3-isopropylmalate/(R)-2-methylmalate dehydratase large subunit